MIHNYIDNLIRGVGSYYKIKSRLSYQFENTSELRDRS